MRPALLFLAVLGLAGCRAVTAPRGDCPRGQVLCPPNVGIATADMPSVVCTEPCRPGADFGRGIGYCDDTGCPRYFLP